MKNPFASLGGFIREKRNLAVAMVQHNTSPQPLYTAWSIEKAVKEGYKCNAWVYRSVFLKAKAGSSVPWYVVDKEGERVENHHLTKLLEHPNPFISKQDLFELVIAWLELAGNSYLKKAGPGDRTEELWPVSPDRLHPLPSNNPEEWMKGFALDRARTATYKPEEIIHHKYFNPANPLIGIAPLEAVGRTVDVDNGQKDFNKSTTQNRGVVEGVFTFDRAFDDISQTDAIRDKLNENHRGKRTFGVLGSNAKYIRTAMSPAEMDFILSGKANREEIFIAFGVPPVYAGVMEGATMNNYKTSELIFWFGTMLFLLDDIKDTFNFSFKNELAEGEHITYDITGIPAIREAMLAKTKTAKGLFEMGVPFSQLNKVFQFGFEEFEEWEKSYVSNAQSDPIANDSATRGKYTLVERREDVTERMVEVETAKRVPSFYDVLQTQQEIVFDALDENRGVDIKSLIDKTSHLLSTVVEKTYVESAVEIGSETVIEKREIEEDLNAAIEEYLRQENIILTEISLINGTTVDKLISQVRNATDTGMNTSDLQQAILDSGIFSESRALMLARTITGTASNLGQFQTALLAGATHKTWSTSLFEVRKSHKKLEGKTIPIDERFKVGGEYAMFP